MLYLIYGGDTIRSKKRLKELKEFWKKKYAGEPIIAFDEDNASGEELKNFAKGTSLFHQKHLIVLNRVLENDEIGEVIIKNFPMIKNSENVFLFWEEKINAKTKNLFLKNQAKIEIFDSKTKQNFYAAKNPLFYKLTDAIFEKKKRLALNVFYTMLSRGISEEEIFWQLWWQLKALFLISNRKEEKLSAIEKKTGFHPYVIKKCLDYSRFFSREQTEEMLKNLILSYQCSKLGFRELNNEIELFILKV